MPGLTFSMENYLEAIYELSRDGKGAHISDIADKLGVSKASTNSAMATLSEKGLITNEKYREVFLTPAGLEKAEFTSEKHKIIRTFFTQILQIDAAVADKDACAIEHVISKDSVRAMYEFMKTESDKP